MSVLRWVIGLSFLAMALWMLVPDKLDDDTGAGKQRFGVFGTTVVAFFLAEMGDKTQIATVALAARYSELLLVGRAVAELSVRHTPAEPAER
mgnify:CR=1 FL=1